MKLLEDSCDPKSLSPLSLAFVGDAVYELMVRERLLCRANRQAGRLHGMSVKMVKAAAQAKAAACIMPMLTEAELSVYKRGRNAHPSHTPKNADLADYHAATGFEALFGFIYLSGNLERLNELFDFVTEALQDGHSQLASET